MLDTEQIYLSLIAGIRKYFDSAQCHRAVVGLSGGIDSAVVICLAQDALGKDNVQAILMPSPFSTVHSVTDALKLCELNHLPNFIIPIDSIYHRFIKEMSSFLDHTEFDTTEENLQARIRANILMAYSNKHKAFVLNTSNKSELAMGYGTLYGDLCGAMMVIGDCYKTDVYNLARLLNSERPRIPENIILKEPSAELHPDQKDSDSLPPYEVLDDILYHLIELSESKEALVEQGKDSNVIDWILKRMNSVSFKVMQVPPVIRLSKKPLLPDFKCL